MQLIIYTNSGNTFEFNNVSNLKHLATGILFDFVGKATGAKRTANFDYKSTAGYSISQD